MDWIFMGWSYFQQEYGETTLRLILAVVLGGLVGIEREQNNHPAGFRTHILVCVGSALIMLLSVYGFEEFISKHSDVVVADPARLAAQVVSGIGFLGAGTILVHGGTIRGLTTAASLWVVAGIGLALGAGFYYGAVLVTVLVLISLVILNRFEENVISKSKNHEIKLTVVDMPGKLGSIATALGDKGISIKKLDMKEQTDEGFVHMSIHVRLPGNVSPALVLDEIKKVEGIKSLTLTRQ